MRKGSLIIFGLMVAGAALAGPALIRAARNNTVIRVETRLIQVNVVARDSHGRPITNLTKKDFKIYDNGKPVPIAVFSALSTATGANAQPLLPPDVYSNRVEGAAPSVTVVLLDGLNTKFADQAWARTEVVSFLQEIKPQDRVAIMLLGSRLFVLQNFTSNPKILLAALKHAPIHSMREVDAAAAPTPAGVTDAAAYNLNGGVGTYAGASPQQYQAALQQVVASAGSAGASARAAAAAGNPAAGASAGMQGAAADEARLQQVMLQFQEHTAAFFRTDQANRTLDALMAIANYLAHFPGRKNLIWVSSSFPIDFGFDTDRQPGDTRDQVDFTQQFRAAYKALNNADIAVYPVDARGMIAGAPGSTDWNNFYHTVGTMKELATNTGGQAFYNTNNMAQVMKAAVDNSNANYTLGFYPQNIRWDGKYHDLKVKVDQGGVDLQYRRGYFAVQEKPKDETKSEYALNRAIYGPLDSTGLGLTVKVLKFQHVPEGRVLLGIDMNPENMTLQPAGPGKKVNLSVVLVQKNNLGTVIHTGGYDMNLRVKPDGVPRLMTSGLDVAKWVTLVHGAETLMLVVRDPGSGRVGSVRIPLGNW